MSATLIEGSSISGFMPGGVAPKGQEAAYHRQSQMAPAQKSQKNIGDDWGFLLSSRAEEFVRLYGNNGQNIAVNPEQEIN